MKSFEEDRITYGDIRIALSEIGVNEPKKVLDMCAKCINDRWDIINKKYLHSKEEAALISTYTYGQDDGSKIKFPYQAINQILRGNDDRKAKEQMKNKKSYLRLLLRVLHKLPRTKPQTLYRGIKNVKHEYKVGKEILWKGFSSTSTSMEATIDFLTDKETKNIDGTLFDIRWIWGYNVSDFSVFSGENGKKTQDFNFLLFSIEILLEPMLRLRVKSVTKQERLTIVVVKPIKQVPIQKNKIFPGCIRHILTNLEKNKEFKETCIKLCVILCNINMDDDTSRKFIIYHKTSLMCILILILS